MLLVRSRESSSWYPHIDGRDLKSLLSFSCPCSGIINPIEAKQRKGKGAVGAYGSERTTQSLQDFPVADSEEEAEEVMRGPAMWAAPGLGYFHAAAACGLHMLMASACPHTHLCGRPCWGSLLT